MNSIKWVDISKYWFNPPVPNGQRMTFVDCFCGAGGLSKGLEMSGMEGICGLDWFKEASDTYRRNFNHPLVFGDITQQETKEEFYAIVQNRLNGRELDVVAGGFPCQSFSLAGQRLIDDPRGSLYKELVEVVRTLSPKFVICENVRGLLSMSKGEIIQQIVEDFHNIGYEVTYAVLCAADYYTPQIRERVILIGNRIGVTNLHPKPILSKTEYKTVRDAIEDIETMDENKEWNHILPRHKPFLVEKLSKVQPSQNLNKHYTCSWKRCDYDKPSLTVMENHGATFIHPVLNRCTTPRELARLQSFPDDFIFEGSKSKQLVQIGNAVPCFLGKAIGLSVRIANNNILEKKE